VITQDLEQRQIIGAAVNGNMIKLLDILNEMYPPYKANMLQKVRYKASDTFTNDPKVATKKGYAEGFDDPIEPGILKKRLGTLSCTRVKAAKGELKDKGTHYAKALQRYLNYHCQ